MALTVYSLFVAFWLTYHSLVNYFLQTQPNNSIILEITGPRRPEDGLVMPSKITAFTKSAAIRPNLKDQITHLEELCKHTKIEITDTEEKLLSFADSAVV